MATLAFEGLGPAAAIDHGREHVARKGFVQALAQAVCGWSHSGHEMILKTEGTRLYLQCRHCFHETQGWEIERRPHRAR
jgi:hypothetical protein